MTEGQYRALVAHLSFWLNPKRKNPKEEDAMQCAMNDIGIMIDKQTVIDELWRCGWRWNEEKQKIRYAP